MNTEDETPNSEKKWVVRFYADLEKEAKDLNKKDVAKRAHKAYVRLCNKWNIKK